MPAAPAGLEVSVSSDGPAASGWRLHLLGQPRLARIGGAALRRLSPKDAALLALVALEGPVACERAEALIWPRVDRHKGDTNLRQRLFRMRRDFGADLVRGGAALQLAGDVETDLAAMLALIEVDPHAGREELLGTLAFEAHSELARWIDAARRRWQAERDAVLARMAAHCEADGAVANGLVYARRLVESNPLSEHALRRLMRLHYLRGDCSAAIAVFEDFERRLKDELGSRPSAETIELLGTIERSAGSMPPHRAVVPASLLRPPRLVGRSAELAALSRIWLERRTFALVGEAGIGKTRLLQAFAAAQQGVVTVRAQPGDAGTAGALLARLERTVIAERSLELADAPRAGLAPLLREPGPAADGGGEPRRAGLEGALEATLAAALQAGLRAIIFDDLHLADASSTQALLGLIASETGSRLDWGWSLRPEGAGRAAADLCAALEESRRLVPLALGPLDVGQMAELVESLALPQLDAGRLAAALLRHGGGNPLFALETLKELLLSGASGDGATLPLPASVGALISRRLGQLSMAARRLVQAAALIGPSLSAELIAAVLDLHPLELAEPWRELESAHIILAGAFAHELMFAAARASVPEPIALLLQRRIAERLPAQPAAPVRVPPPRAIEVPPPIG
jgi:DNA-binding SARP family transcriptional activator